MNRYIYNNYLINKAEKQTFKITDSFSVMERAAKSCFEYISKNFSIKKVLIVCGPGNNGGDGLLIAQHLLNENYIVNINFPFSNPKTKDSIKALNLLKDKNIIIEKPALKKYDLIIDAIFGTGFRHKLKDEVIELFKEINKLKTHVISIDMPSGISSDTGQKYEEAIEANATLTFHRYKPGQWLLPGKKYCGKIELLDIELVNLDAESKIQLNFPEKLPIPNMQDHKFSRGSCLILAGKNLVGAAKLGFLSASQSSLRAGAGLCKLVISDSDIDFFKPHILEEMITTYNSPENLRDIIKNENNEVIIYGCGIESNENNHNILKLLIQQPKNLVLDAAVFTMMQEKKNYYMSELSKRNCSTIMTPHSGEFKRVFPISDNKIKDGLFASKESKSVVIYKGNDTVISSPTGETVINFNTSPYLATAGSGDVLAGLVGGFLSQGIDALNSAKLGCYVHSQCGINLGAGLTAGDLIKEIPKVIKSLISDKSI